MPLTPIPPSDLARRMQLESRESESMFRRYEPMIALAVNNFPIETPFERPMDLSMEYFVNRFRAALSSYLRHNWPSSQIDREKLLRIRKLLVISGDPNGKIIWVRQRGPKARPAFSLSNLPIPGELGAKVQARWVDAKPEELKSLSYLLASGRITGPVIIPDKVPDDLVTGLLADFPISIVYDQERNETLFS